MSKFLVFALGILFLTYAELWSKGKEIVLENDIYYVIYPDGKKVSIVSSEALGGSPIEVVFSPDSNYVVYIASNGGGFEGEGRDLYYCKTDSSERTLVVSTSAGIGGLNWIKTVEKQYIVFLQGIEDMGHVRVYDFDKHRMVFDTVGLGLVRIGNTATFLVNDFLFSEKKAFVLDLSKTPFVISKLDSLRGIGSDTSETRCAHASIGQAPEPGWRWVGFVPPDWPHRPYNVSDYIDLVFRQCEFTRLSTLVPSPNNRFVAFSATGAKFTCNGILDTETHKPYALRFFLGTFDAWPCWSSSSKYVAFINPVDFHNKFINVFSIDSILNSKYPMVADKKFECPADKYIKTCFSSDSDTLYFEVTGCGKVESGELTLRR